MTSRLFPSSGGLLLLAVMGAGLAGCATGPSVGAALEGHEGLHGPPWAPNEAPWVAPPVLAADLWPYPYYSDLGWYGGGLGLGFAVLNRPHFRHFGFGGPGFRGGRGFHGGFHGGHGRGGGGRGRH
jgi:hypothetical protein